ncbi:unnamed protein product [Paramecium pentaurelia]|uniref:TLDc domain-containing protein n=1 Tax=Paramecium pentaurelia TaxID=43138 RepID=A0A8S1WJY0_9CILI|nr:unnamed protein product [Paramecium pentaurelia]
MLKEEVIKKECIKNDHKGFQIVAVDLSDELIKESDQKKYYCVKCLLEKIGNKKIILFEEAIKKSEIVNQELKKCTADKQKETRESIQKLSDVIKSIEGSFKKQFDDLKKQLEIQIDNEQKKLDKIPEPTTPNDDIKLLSSCYQEDGKLASPPPNIDYKEITESLIQIRKLLKQLENFEQLQDVDKEIQKIEQTCSINLEINEKYKKTPALNVTCDTHKMEIIMFNLNQDQFEQTNPFLCVECAQDLLTRGNKAVSNTISLMKAEEKWNEYIKEQMEKRSQRQSRLNQAIAFIKKLQEKQNSELNKMIQSLNEQLKKQPKEYEELMKLRNTHLKNQDKQNLLEIVKILGQQKNIEFISNQEDLELYQSQKRILEELIKENLVIENQLQWLQNYDKLPKRSNDSENEKEVVEFLKKSTIQDLYLSFFEMSFNSLSQFKKEENDLQLQGKLLKIQSSDQENQNEALQNQRKWYQQFQQSQAKLEKFKKVDELQRSKEEYDELLMQNTENEKKIKYLETLNNNLKTQVQKADIKIESMNQMISKNKIQNQEVIEEIQKVYSIQQLQWKTGDTRLLQYDYAQKIYRKIEERTKKQIKNKYLLCSLTGWQLNFSKLWCSIDKMSSLLMIFKSKSQFIFGGFSPCQWLLKSGGNNQNDQELQSFLFSQTQDEIYPLESKSTAISGSESQISFGSQDIIINNNFQEGSSNLGYSYSTIQYKIPNKQNHLFGSPKPNIMVCEVIMLTFV